MNSTSYNNFDQGGVTASAPPLPMQGQAINATAYAHSSGYPELPSKGEQQPDRCNDVFWGFLFYCHIIAMGVLTATYLPETLSGNHSYNNNNNGNNNNNNNNNYQDDDYNYYNYDDYGDDGAPYYNNLDDYYAIRGLKENDTGTNPAASITNYVIGMVARNLHRVANIGSHRNLEDAVTNPNGVFFLVMVTILCSFLLSILTLTIMIRFAQGLIKMRYVDIYQLHLKRS